jgi:hypothetical protein
MRAAKQGLIDRPCGNGDGGPDSRTRLVKAPSGGWEHSDLQTQNSHHIEMKKENTYAKATNKSTR